MKYAFEPQDILDYFKRMVEIPSPVAYYTLMNPVMEQLAG